MSLKQWEANGWLKPHQTSAKEISNLLRIVERDLNDAQGVSLQTGVSVLHTRLH